MVPWGTDDARTRCVTEECTSWVQRKRLAELALDQLARTWYATGMARVRAVRASLSQWESQPCVRRLDERLYDWNTTINALAG